MENKLKNFWIRSENKYLLEAIKNELAEMGYTFSSPKICTTFTGITHNWPIGGVGDKNIDNFMELYYGDYSSNNIDKIFNLPQDYDKAIDFCKEQMAIAIDFYPPKFTLDGKDITINKNEVSILLGCVGITFSTTNFQTLIDKFNNYHSK